MKQLTLGDVLTYITHLQSNERMDMEDILNLPIYIGDDDELNGIHTAWYVEKVAEGESKSIIELINENRGNVDFNSKAILIS